MIWHFRKKYLHTDNNVLKFRFLLFSHHSVGVATSGGDLCPPHVGPVRSECHQRQLPRHPADDAAIQRCHSPQASTCRNYGISDKKGLSMGIGGGAKLEGVEFRCSRLGGVEFIVLDLKGVEFCCTRLEGAEFRCTRLEGVEFHCTRLQWEIFLCSR